MQGIKHVVKTSDYYTWLVSSVNVLEQSIKFVVENPTLIEPDKMTMEELIRAKAYLARLKDEYYRVEYLNIYKIEQIEIPAEYAILFYKSVISKAKSSLYVQ